MLVEGNRALQRRCCLGALFDLEKKPPEICCRVRRLRAVRTRFALPFGHRLGIHGRNRRGVGWHNHSVGGGVFDQYGTQVCNSPLRRNQLAPVYAQALAERERESGPENAKTAHAAADFGRFLLQIGKSAEAEAPLQRAVAIDQHNSDPAIDADRESLALALDSQSKHKEAFEYFRQAAEGNNPRVAARSFARLAEMDPDHADIYSRNAVTSEEKASGAGAPRVAILLHEYALALRARNRDPEAEPLLRRALSIQQSAAKADPQVTISVLNTLGNLLEGRQQLDEAEKLERMALTVSEERLGPESVQLAMTCTNLADVLWNKKNLREAGQLYRRAIAVDASLYGPDRPETADDIANLGMLMNDAGQPAAGAALLRQALAIYEKALGPTSDRAQFIRQRLAQSGH